VLPGEGGNEVEKKENLQQIRQRTGWGYNAGDPLCFQNVEKEANLHEKKGDNLKERKPVLRNVMAHSRRK